MSEDVGHCDCLVHVQAEIDFDSDSGSQLDDEDVEVPDHFASLNGVEDDCGWTSS